MNIQDIIKKADAGEDLTVEEIIIYEANVKPKQQVYGKYGTLAKQYIEEHDFAKYLCLAGDLPDYLHGIDKAADKMWDVMYEKLSHDPRYKRTKNYLEDVRRENAIKQLIEEEILNEIVYV